MKKLSGPNLYVALTHYPVVNKKGDIIASAVTNLDLHDIARAARTFGVKAFYVITPLTDQKKLVDKIVRHWTAGTGSTYNPQRRDALELIRVCDSVAQAADHIGLQGQGPPKIAVTCARRKGPTVGFDRFREMIEGGTPHLLVFGTAWGLSDAFIAEADYALEPIRGSSDYNHLSVRCAAAIVLDRVVGDHRHTNVEDW